MTTVLVLRFGEDVKTNAIALPVFIKKLQLFFKDFSRVTLHFQKPPTRNIISQIVHKCTFPVYPNKALRLELFASPLHNTFSFIRFAHMSILSRLSLVFNSSIFALPDEELLQEHAVLDLDSHLETLLVCVLAQHILFLLDFSLVLVQFLQILRTFPVIV